MRRTNVDMRAGGLSHWPRRLILGTVVLGFAVLVGLWAYGLAIDKAVSPNVAGTLLLGCLTLGPGCILARLACPGEANPWRTTGIWIALLSYLGGIAALTLALIGDAIAKVDWWPGGLDMLDPGAPLPAGLVRLRRRHLVGDRPRAGLVGAAGVRACRSVHPVGVLAAATSRP